MNTTPVDEEAGGLGDAGELMLDRATAALRDSAVPEGPSPLARERTLAALAAASAGPAGRPGPSPGRWAFGSSASPLRRVAAVLLLSAAAAAAAAAYVVAAYRGQVATPINPTPRGNDRTTGPKVRVASSGSMVTGEIRFDGDPPPPQLINVQLDPACARQHQGPMYDDSLLVNQDNSLQNVVVSVVAGLPEGKTWAAPPEPVYLDQDQCTFKPHVLAMMAGQKVLVRNFDPDTHDTHSLAVKNQPFNLVQPHDPAGRPVPSPTVPEFFQVRCDLHPWMHAWFCVFSHPYFQVCCDNGTFTMRNLPPGRYRLRAWHEKLGAQERDVVVKAGHDETINFVFHAPPAPAKPPGQAANDPGAGSPAQRTSLASAE